MPQHSLFELEPPAWQLDDAGEQLVPRSCFPPGPSSRSTTRCPIGCATRSRSAAGVRVPLGKSDRLVTGYLVGLESRQVDGRRLKRVAELVDGRSLLSPAMLRLTRGWPTIICVLGAKCWKRWCPPASGWQAGTREALFVPLAPDAAAQARQLKLSGKQRQILEHLAGSGKPLMPRQIAGAVGCTLAPINLLASGASGQPNAAYRCRRDCRAAWCQQRHLTLNSDQQTALAGPGGAGRAATAPFSCTA